MPGRYPTLAALFDPRSNSLNVLRLTLAVTVAVVHGMENGFGHQPQVGSTDLGSLAVDGFFVISGFLVARSFLRLGSLRRYAWHRFLRIAPGFWVCLLVTAAVVAPLAAVLSGRPATAVLEGPETAVSYVTANAALLMRQFGVSAVTDPVEGGQAVLDGSLWTLFFEACCYGAVAALGVLGVLRRRRWLLLACGLLWAATIASAAGVDLGTELMLRFLFVFLLGAAGHVFADRVPVSGLLAAACVPLVVAGLHLLPDHRALAGPAFAYLFLWAAVRLPLRQDPRWDLSYGLYVYHWPIQLLLALAGAAALGTAGFVALSLLLACAAAAASWLLVESPALRLKDAAWVEAPLPRRRTA
ncbi:acyltransferase family protein [Kineococcus sp. TRM81007]|uniref:acyltransferase family protein n=1 Tax=Kineococcus sp. TRM81007 TaxID=2925831 RepID=UPI001F56D266|nr:acyltransferase family protein [Kineococcus sp. TRM81007]MCI2239851.1 acyltransferase family protein [Kineococcus sp. TRM81007]